MEKLFLDNLDEVIRKRIVEAMGVPPDDPDITPVNCLDFLRDPELEKLLILALAIRPPDFECRTGADDRTEERGDPPEGDFMIMMKRYPGWTLRMYENSVIEIWPNGPGSGGAGATVFWRPEEVQEALDAQRE